MAGHFNRKRKEAMSERGLIEKSYSRYMKEGDYGLDISTGFPLIVRDNCRKHFTRVCEVFGWYHEFGSVWAKNLRLLTQEEFETLKRAMPCE